MKKSVAVAAGAIMALGMAAPAFADSEATGSVTDAAGVLSGNMIQIPVHVPLNLCGSTVNVIALLNPASGIACSAL